MSDLFGETAPESRKEAPLYVTIARDVTNINGDTISAKAGAILEVIKRDGSLYLLRMPDGGTRYFNTESVKPYTPAPVTRIPTPRTVRPTSRAARMEREKEQAQRLQALYNPNA